MLIQDDVGDWEETVVERRGAGRPSLVVTPERDRVYVLALNIGAAPFPTYGRGGKSLAQIARTTSMFRRSALPPRASHMRKRRRSLAQPKRITPVTRRGAALRRRQAHVVDLRRVLAHDGGGQAGAEILR